MICSDNNWIRQGLGDTRHCSGYPWGILKSKQTQ
jgi:hypothetical protein